MFFNEGFAPANKTKKIIFLCKMKECEKRENLPNLSYYCFDPSSDHDGCFYSPPSPAVHVLLKAGERVEGASNTLVTRGT